MRDDIRDLFDNLLKHLNSKTILLNLLLDYEKSASDLIKKRNDAEDGILKITEDETNLIDAINVEDYNISKIKDEIIRRYNFDFLKVFKKEYNTSEKEILNYKNEILHQEEIIKKINILKKENIHSMEQTQEDLKIQITELARIASIKISIPKDPQSF